MQVMFRINHFFVQQFRLLRARFSHFFKWRYLNKKAKQNKTPLSQISFFDSDQYTDLATAYARHLNIGSILNPFNLEIVTARQRLSLLDLIEKLNILYLNLVWLQIERDRSGKHHRRFGITEDEQLRIYAKTLSYMDSFYSALSGVISVTKSFPLAFVSQPAQGGNSFLLWLLRNSPFGEFVDMHLKPARDFRSVTAHSSGGHSFNWHTGTQGRSGIFVVLSEKGGRNHGVRAQTAKIKGEDYRFITSPNEYHVFSTLVDISMWLTKAIASEISSPKPGPLRIGSNPRNIDWMSSDEVFGLSKIESKTQRSLTREVMEFYVDHAVYE